MADIDKTLSELGTSVKIDGPDQEVEIQKQEEANKPPVEINPTEDGGVELNFDPSKVNIEGQPNHFDNLAELLPDDILEPIGLELFSIIQITNLQEKIGKDLIQMDLIY